MKQKWTPKELAESWTLSTSALKFLGATSHKNRLGYALLLRFFQLEGRFPESKNEIPKACAAFIAEQLESPVELFLAFFKYGWDDRTSRHRRAEIRSFCGFREATTDDSRQISDWLVENYIPGGANEQQIQAAAYQRLKELKIEPPERSRIVRLVRSATKRHENKVFEDITAAISKRVRKRLEALIELDEDEEDDDNEQQVNFTQLRQGPGGPNLKSILHELDKLDCLKAVALPENLFEHLSPKLVELYKQRAATEKLRELRRHPDYIKYPLVAAFCHVRLREITDSVIQLAEQVIHRIGKRAEKKVVTEFVADLKRVHGKQDILFRVAQAAIANPDGTVRDVIFPVVSEQTLRDLVNEFKNSGPFYDQKVNGAACSAYSRHWRRMVPRLLTTLDFRSNNENHQPVIRALEILKKKGKLTKADLKKLPIDEIVKPSERDLVFKPGVDGKPEFDPMACELHILNIWRDGIRRKEIWEPNAGKYQNPDKDLPPDFDTKRHEYYKALKLPIKAETFIQHLQLDMKSSLGELNDTILSNPKVRFNQTGKIIITPLKAEPTPPNLESLAEELERRWSMTKLLDVLKETELRTGFTRCFKSVATREVLDRKTIQRRLLLCFNALGTNIGLKRGGADERLSVLQHIVRRFITTDSTRDAIRVVVNDIFRIRHEHIWGEGTTACAADSKQFGALDQNLMTEWHARYGGRGVMIYWHVERKSTCIYSQLKTCSSSEVASMIEGVLRHCTNMSVDKAYTDTHGKSEVAFAFCHLLGFELLPRIKGIKKQKLYRPEAGNPQAFPNLQPALTRPINWELIRQQYDEMVKFATAIKCGTSDAESILRRFTSETPQHPTYTALLELGRAVKTVFLCRYLKSEELRREIHQGLNVVEHWNSVNGFIHFGKRGEMASNNLDDQELSMLSLHLLQVSMVYINTLMLQEVLAEDAWAKRMTAEDYRGLNPLGHRHLNPFGDIGLDMNTRLALKAA